MSFVSLIALVGSIASVIGIPIAVVGVFQARRAARESVTKAEASRMAAAEARERVEAFRRDLTLLHSVVDLERSLSLMEDLKVFLRHETLAPVPEKISNLVYLLNTLRAPSGLLTKNQQIEVQNAVLALRRVENALLPGSAEGSQELSKGLLPTVSETIDLLFPILLDLKDQIGGAR